MHGHGPSPARLVVVPALLAFGAAVLLFSGDEQAAEQAGPAGKGRAGCTKVAGPDGSDGNPGTLRRPFRTPQRLADSLRRGQTGCLRSGTYRASDGYVLEFERAGTASAPIRIRSYPGERARLVGTVHVPEGSDHVVLSDVDVEGDGSMNTIKVYAADAVIERNDITNELRGESCIILGSDSAGQARRTIVRANRFHDCGSPANDNKDHSIYAANLADGRIVDNVFVNSAGLAIQLYPSSQRTVVAHNVIDGGSDTVRGGIVIGGDGDYTSNDNVVERNVIAYAADDNVYSYWDGDVGSGNVVRHNCLWGAGDDQIDRDDGGFTAVGNATADPGFADRRARDYRLARGSTCLKVVRYDTAAKLRRAWRCSARAGTPCARR